MDKYKGLLTDRFLAQLTEVAKIYGWSGDYFEIGNFVEGLYIEAGKTMPDMAPYEQQDIDEVMNKPTTEHQEMTAELLFDELKKCKTLIDFLTIIKQNFGATLMMGTQWESWIEFYGKEVPGTRRKRFMLEHEIKDLLFISGL